ncbi:MAG: hypothetical protein JWO50_666 [Candidatus Kaiserbacteria bacterium]|nr:hypothetical protein [Candidatus Kaiserbacteria bacterium]
MNFGSTSMALPYVGHIQPDSIIIAALIIGISAIAVKWGTARACVIAITLPVTAFIYTLVHDGFLVSTIDTKLTSPLMQSALFGIIVVFVYITTHRMYRSFVHEGESIALAILAGIASTCIVLVVWIQTPALMSIWNFSNTIDMLFGAAYALWWILGSLLVLAYVRS